MPFRKPQELTLILFTASFVRAHNGIQIGRQKSGHGLCLQPFFFGVRQFTVQPSSPVLHKGGYT